MLASFFVPLRKSWNLLVLGGWRTGNLCVKQDGLELTAGLEFSRLWVGAVVAMLAQERLERYALRLLQDLLGTIPCRRSLRPGMSRKMAAVILGTKSPRNLLQMMQPGLHSVSILHYILLYYTILYYTGGAAVRAALRLAQGFNPAQMCENVVSFRFFATTPAGDPGAGSAGFYD